ncbi:MAG: two-component system, OmpR family, sensor kinase [Actinomycetota bacterium]|nr:two-component system, OmpR family, sensor kinase [Actinomycetota bacterium]
MTLRLRLVVALFALMLAGLGLFGVVTYTVYARSQYQRLDEQIRAAVPFATRQLAEQARSGSSSSNSTTPTTRAGTGRGSDSDAPPPLVPLSTYSELRDATGKVLVAAQLSSTTSKPKLGTVVAPAPPARFFTVGSATGSGTWRVFVSPVSGPDATGPGEFAVVAIPTNDVTTALRRLVFIEISGSAVLLLLLSTGAWVIMRRGLRPLEEVAETAGAITAGDMTRRVSATAPSTEVGQLGIAFNTMLDEIQEAFAARDATEQRLRQFLADVSHELRTPLTSIQGFAELFRIGDPQQIDLATILRRIEQESARMRELVEDLLLLARLDQTRPTERKPVDLAVLAADACSDIAAAAPDRDIVLDAPEPIVLVGDEALLRQAIANLTTNAVKHTPEGSRVDVSTRLVDGHAVVEVRDHGAGLDADALAHAYDRFWQADKARAGAGAGLGLAIVESVAHDHGGTVTATNAPDGGAIFTMDLPISPSHL